jgi:hypothetical protein
MVWEVIYINGRILERKYLKWAHIAHLDIWNTSYGQKKGQESNWQFDPLPLKVRNRPDFRCVQIACDMPLESSQRRLQLCFRPYFNQRFTCKVMAPQSHRSPNLGNFGTPTWESWDKKPFRCGPRGKVQSIL